MEISSTPMAHGDPQPVFFPVSVPKLAVMSLCTVGLYQVYWFYANWRLIKRGEHRRLSAPWRSVLGLIFALPLFNRMARSQGKLGLAIAVVSFFVWVILTLVAYAPVPWMALSFASVLPLLPMQSMANDANMRVAPGHAPNSSIRGWNIVALVIGGPVVALNALGLVMYAVQA